MATPGRLLRSAIAWCQATLRHDLRQGISQHILVVLVGHVIRLALGLASSALLARGLGPAGLSVFSVLSVTVTIGVTVADFGLSESAIRRIAGHLEDAPAEARQTAGTFARFKLIGGLMVAGSAFVLAGPIARGVNLPLESGALLVRIAALGLLATVLSGIMASVLRALRRFGALMVMQSANISLTVFLMATLFIIGRLTPVRAVLVGAAAAAGAAALGFRLLSPAWRAAVLSKGNLMNDEGRRLLSFSKWLWVSMILSILASQLDLLLVNQWMTPRVVGFYALALNLSQKAGIVNQTLHVVLLPTVSALKTRPSYVAYMRRSLTRSVLLGLPLLLTLPVARPLILSVYGIEYAPSISVFRLLMAGVLFDLLVSPILLLVFPLDMPRLIAAGNGARVAILVIAAALLLPVWGMKGAVLAKLAATLAGAILTGAFIARRLHADSEPVRGELM
jgi:O-antigen/teichoic acid export membrane protein